MTPGLADAHDGDAVGIDLVHILQQFDGGVEMLRGFVIADVIACVARMERVLIGVAKEAVGRNADKALTGETFRQILRVRNEAIAFVHHDDSWRGPGHISRNCDEGRQAAVSGNGFCGDVGHDYLPVGFVQ